LAFFKLSGHRRAALLAAVALLSLASGCKGDTTLSAVEQPEGYNVRMEMDPLTLNPPQLGSLTFGITSNETQRPVTAFQPLFGESHILHNIIIRDDLEYFRHDVAELVIDNKVSAPAYFPTFGSYKIFTFYEPVGAELQQYHGRVVSGEPIEEANLLERGLNAVIANSVRFDLVTGTAPIKAGQVSQFAFYLTERGQPVTALGPAYGAVGHLWIIDGEGRELAHEIGRSDSRRLLPTRTAVPDEGGQGQARGTVTPGPGRGTPDVTRSGTAGSTPGVSERQGGSSEPIPRALSSGLTEDTTPPTLVPDLRNALATVTALPRSTLQPVQQTAQVSVLQTPGAPPEVGFGPTVIFEHRFSEAGLYKMWLEVQYRNEIIQTDWVVRVVP
jgi:hypothetical protein